MIPRYVVVPSHNRPKELKRLVESLVGQCHRIVIVDNASEPEVSRKNFDIPEALKTTIIQIDEQPPNISRLWNIGLNTSEEDYYYTYCNKDCVIDTWDVAILNDDAVVPPLWYDYVSENLRASSALTACTDPHGILKQKVIKTKPDNDVRNRLCGWAFLLRGESKIRLDENLRWWWGDTDLDFRARQSGGMMILPAFAVGNTLANGSTRGVLAKQSGLDRQTFKSKWGYNPW